MMVLLQYSLHEISAISHYRDLVLGSKRSKNH